MMTCFFLLFFTGIETVHLSYRWSSTKSCGQLAIGHTSAGGFPIVQFPFPYVAAVGFEPRPFDYQADVLPPDHAATPNEAFDSCVIYI